jgi:hypothetical protein
LARVAGHEDEAKRLSEQVAQRKAKLFPPVHKQRPVQVAVAALGVSVLAVVVSVKVSAVREQERQAAYRAAAEAANRRAAEDRRNASEAERTRLLDTELRGDWVSVTVPCKQDFYTYYLQRFDGSKLTCRSTFTIRSNKIDVSLFFQSAETHYEDGSEVYRYDITLECAGPPQVDRIAGTVTRTCESREWHRGQRIYDSEYVQSPLLRVQVSGKVPSLMPDGGLSNEGRVAWQSSFELQKPLSRQMLTPEVTNERLADYPLIVKQAEEARRALGSRIEVALSMDSAWVRPK